MELGLAILLADYSMPPARLGRLAEERGFGSYSGGGELPREYSHTLDPFVALAAAAGVTERLKLGTGICLVVERDPITTAKQVATLDHVSGGRFLFGVGAGWNLEEMRNHGTDPRRRFSIMRERIEAMKAIWAEDEAEYHGEHVDFDPIWSWPKPVQRPHPPVLVGGLGEKVIDRVLAYGDEWMPNRVEHPEALGERIAELQRRAEEAGRGRIPVTVFHAKPEARFVDGLRAVGVDRCLLYLRPEEPDAVERRLDELARLL
jgi:probable F420-dependent oxidoreductase